MRALLSIFGLLKRDFATDRCPSDVIARHDIIVGEPAIAVSIDFHDTEAIALEPNDHAGICIIHYESLWHVQSIYSVLVSFKNSTYPASASSALMLGRFCASPTAA